MKMLTHLPFRVSQAVSAKLLLKVALMMTFAIVFASTLSAQILPPQGRLTFTSNTPVMTTDVPTATTLYYTPYVGNSIVTSNGTSLSNLTFSQLSMSMTSNTSADQIYDVFAYYTGGALQLCIAGSWNPSKFSRSTGFELTTLQGIWVNANLEDCYTATNHYSMGAKTALYLGSIYTQNTGSTSFQLTPAPTSGGITAEVFLFNAYNRVRATARSRDSKSTWADVSTSWSSADGFSPQVKFLDGLQVYNPKARYAVCLQTSTGATGALIGLNLDSATNTPDSTSSVLLPSATGTSAPLNVEEPYTPQLGLHSVTAMESVSGTTTITFYGSIYGCEDFTLEVEY